MKEYRIMILLVSTLFIIAISCSSQLDNEDFSDMIGKGQNYTPPPIPVEEPTLKDKDGWKIDSIDGKSFIWYSYNKGAFNAQQQVNVLESTCRVLITNWSLFRLLNSILCQALL